MMMTDQSASYGGEVSAELQRTQNSSHLSAEGSPFIGSTGTGEQMEDEEEGDHSGEQVYIDLS